MVAGGMLAASAFAAPVAGSAAVTPSASGTADCDSVTTCYTPQQIQVAYGLRPLLDRGIDGRGETVVLPAIAELQLSPPLVSDIRADLTGFDELFHLPAPRLDVTTRFAPGASRWLSYGEETLDVEMIHAIAPEAAIRVILFTPAAVAATASLAAVLTETVRAGTSSGDVISISAAVGEHCLTSAQVASLHSALRAAARRHVTVVAGTGDIGPVAEPCTIQIPPPAFTPVRGVSLPASDPFVLAAGGTSLDASHTTGAYIGETAWGLPYGTPGTEFQASGGGFSSLYPRPAYQQGVPGIGTSRGVPDVSADANGHTGMALVISDGGGQYTITDSGGTSAATPFWAGLIALADQYAGHDLGFVNPALYRIARGPLYRRAFHDVTSGNNTVQFPPQTFPGYKAGPGWDPVTGLGSPDAQVLVPLLARDAGR